jgi:hypothetical protein
MIVDATAAARRADPERAREWLAEQRVFISSAMGDTAAERRAVAAVVEEMGARAVWFEEFGRDADAEEAYLTEVDAATIYLAILNEFYGRPNPPDGDSATEMEFRRARQGGKRINVYIASDAPKREGALARFIERVRFYITTENYRDDDDLVRRVRRRMEELAAEALSPWVKLGDFVFRADEIDDSGTTITIRARVSEEIAHQLQTLRDERFGRQRLRFVSRNRVAEGELAGVRRTTRATGPEELTIEVSNVQPPQGNPMRAGTSGRSADELVELGVRALLLGEPIPEQIGSLGFMTDTGIDVVDLQQAFDLPNEFAEPLVRLVILEGLVANGNARRVVSLALGPRDADTRRIALEWEDPRTYESVPPAQRFVEGVWHRPQAPTSP